MTRAIFRNSLKIFKTEINNKDKNLVRLKSIKMLTDIVNLLKHIGKLHTPDVRGMLSLVEA